MDDEEDELDELLLFDQEEANA